MHSTFAVPAPLRLAVLAVVLLASAFGCGKSQADEAEAAKLLGVQVTQQDRAEANDVFASRCTPCHGPSGGGDGPASAALTPKPRNFHDTSWQGSVSNEHLTKIIRFGGAAVGKSPAMPANPDLGDKGPIIAALVGRVRAFGK